MMRHGHMIRQEVPMKFDMNFKGRFTGRITISGLTIAVVAGLISGISPEDIFILAFEALSNK